MDDQTPEVDGEPEEPKTEPEAKPKVQSWDREKVERFMWAYRKMKSNYTPRQDGKPWR